MPEAPGQGRALTQEELDALAAQQAVDDYAGAPPQEPASAPAPAPAPAAPAPEAAPVPPPYDPAQDTQGMQAQPNYIAPAPAPTASPEASAQQTVYDPALQSNVPAPAAEPAPAPAPYVDTGVAPPESTQQTIAAPPPEPTQQPISLDATNGELYPPPESQGTPAVSPPLSSTWWTGVPAEDTAAVDMQRRRAAADAQGHVGLGEASLYPRLIPQFAQLSDPFQDSYRQRFEQEQERQKQAGETYAPPPYVSPSTDNNQTLPPLNASNPFMPAGWQGTYMMPGYQDPGMTTQDINQYYADRAADRRNAQTVGADEVNFALGLPGLGLGFEGPMMAPAETAGGGGVIGRGLRPGELEPPPIDVPYRVNEPVVAPPPAATMPYEAGRPQTRFYDRGMKTWRLWDEPGPAPIADAIAPHAPPPERTNFINAPLSTTDSRFTQRPGVPGYGEAELLNSGDYTGIVPTPETPPLVRSEARPPTGNVVAGGPEATGAPVRSVTPSEAAASVPTPDVAPVRLTGQGVAPPPSDVPTTTVYLEKSDADALGSFMMGTSTAFKVEVKNKQLVANAVHMPGSPEMVLTSHGVSTTPSPTKTPVDITGEGYVPSTSGGEMATSDNLRQVRMRPAGSGVTAVGSGEVTGAPVRTPTVAGYELAATHRAASDARPKTGNPVLPSQHQSALARNTKTYPVPNAEPMTSAQGKPYIPAREITPIKPVVNEGGTALNEVPGAKAEPIPPPEVGKTEVLAEERARRAAGLPPKPIVLPEDIKVGRSVPAGSAEVAGPEPLVRSKNPNDFTVTEVYVDPLKPERGTAFQVAEQTHDLAGRRTDIINVGPEFKTSNEAEDFIRHRTRLPTQAPPPEAEAIPPPPEEPVGKTEAEPPPSKKAKSPWISGKTETPGKTEGLLGLTLKTKKGKGLYMGLLGAGAASGIMKANEVFGSGKAPSGPPTTGTTKAPAKATGVTEGSKVPTSQVTSETQSQAMLDDGAPATGSWITKGGVRVWVSKGPEGITTWGLEPSPGEWETAPDTSADLASRLAEISAKGPIGNPWITAKQNLSGVPTPDEAESVSAAETDVDAVAAEDYVPPAEGKTISPGSVGTPVTEGGMTTEGAVTKDGDIPLYAADGTDSGLVVTKDGEVKQSSGGYSSGSYSGGSSKSYGSGGSSYRFGGSSGGSSYRKKKKKKGTSTSSFGGSSQFWEGFPFNRPPSPIRQQILDAIAASKAKGAAKKGS